MKSVLNLTAGVLVLLVTAAPGVCTEPRIVHLEISGEVSEAPIHDPLGFTSSKHFNTRTLLDRLQCLRHDDSVSAVFITFEDASMGLGQTQDIRAAIERLKSQKEVYIHLDSCYSNGLYWLASAASKLAIVPSGDLWLTGLYGEQLFIKDALSHLHIEADVVHIGDYKSAGEILSRNSPSEASAEMTRWLYDDLYGQMLEQIGSSRGLKKEQMQAIVDRGPYTAEHAKEAGLIDEVAYRMDFVDAIKERHGGAAFEKDCGEDSAPEIDFSNPMAMFRFFGDMMSAVEQTDQASVALIYIVGPIILGDPEAGIFGGENHGASSRLRKALYEAARDPQVKAVVLRVDSPGGSAVASEIIWHASSEVTAQGKPLIVSMGNVAGSGGYYVSCAADTIFAEPGTITGSIGVIGMKLVTKGFWDWMGIHWHPIKRGANADIMAGDRPFSEESRAKITSWMEDVYGVFKSRVLAKRQERLKQPLDDIAGGRVFTGQQALKLGLIDRLGGLEEALRFAALEARLGDEYDVKILPKPKTIFDMLREELGLAARAGDGAMGTGPAQAVWPLIQRLEPRKARAVARVLRQIETLRLEGVILAMPSEVVFE